MSAYKEWKQVLSSVLDKGIPYTDANKRTCIELPNVVVTIQDTKQLTSPIEYLQQQEVWLYPSLQEIADITLAKHDKEVYGYAYGNRLFNFQGSCNQVDEYIIPLLKNDRQSRRACLTLFDPIKDAKPNATNVPGVIALDLKVREEALHITAFIRSNDMFIGWPANIYQFYLLQEYIAARLDIGIGSITTFSASAHVFEEHKPLIRKLVK